MPKYPQKASVGRGARRQCLHHFDLGTTKPALGGPWLRGKRYKGRRQCCLTSSHPSPFPFYGSGKWSSPSPRSHLLEHRHDLHDLRVYQIVLQFVLVSPVAGKGESGRVLERARELIVFLGLPYLAVP